MVILYYFLLLVSIYKMIFSNYTPDSLTIAIAIGVLGLVSKDKK